MPLGPLELAVTSLSEWPCPQRQLRHMGKVMTSAGDPRCAVLSPVIFSTRVIPSKHPSSNQSSMTKSIFPPWDFSTWTDVDDRVRGGSSTSHLEPVHLKAPSGSALSDKPTGAKFFGHLGMPVSAPALP